MAATKRYLTTTYTPGFYLTPHTRRVRPHAGGYAISGFVGETDPYIRDEMLYWGPTLENVEAWAEQNGA